MKNSKHIIASLSILMMLFTIVGCAQENVEDINQESNTSPTVQETEVSTDNETIETTETTEAVTDESSSRIIEHALGSTEIVGQPQRIVTLYQGATDTALALGITPVGVVESWVQKPMYDYLSVQLAGVPIVGLETQPNLEEIAALKPDLIIASKIRHEKIYEQLSQIAPTVAHETVFKFDETTTLLGQAMDMEDEAQVLLDAWTARIEDFKAKAPQQFENQWPVEVSVLNFRSDHARIYTTGFAGDILNALGFTRNEEQQKAADEGSVVVKLTTPESIPSMDGDILFLFIGDGHSPDAEAIQQTYETWTGHPLWQQLRGVQNEKVYIVDEVAWNMGGGIMAANAMLDQIYERFGIE